MRIAQIAPLHESVPPQLYGGTERIVSFLTEELVRLGHEVTLFASGDSVTKAKLVATCDKSLRLNSDCIDSAVYSVLQQEEILERYEDFDIIHNHTDYWNYPIFDRISTPAVTTLHGRLDIKDLLHIYNKFSFSPLISISDYQRVPLDSCRPNWIRTIYHGLPLKLYSLNYKPEGYLAFLGRISPEKRVDRAIEIAKANGLPLKIAAKIDRVDKEYFENKIKHLLEHPLVEYLGEISEREKQDFLGNAKCLLFPIDWPEPFGLVMIEAMACGTPVVAYRKGSVEEVIQPGVSGEIGDNLEDAISAVRNIEKLDRKVVRTYFEDNFNVTKMATNYLQAYRNVIENSYQEELCLKPAIDFDLGEGGSAFVR